MIVDGHSHIGLEHYTNSEATIEEYVENAVKIGVSEAMIMPVPTPELIQNGKKKTVLTWSYHNGKVTYISDFISTAEKITCPYSQVNEYYAGIVRTANELYSKFVFHFVPMIHPLFDTVEYLEALFASGVKAVKVHSLGSGIVPEEVRVDLFQFISEKKIPIIVHVDRDETGYSVTEGMRYFRSHNSPQKWIQLLNEYHCIGIINHGACLDVEALEAIKKSPNLFCGIGPDIYMSSNPERLKVDKKLLQNEGFLQILKKNLPAEKMIFDIDYNYNVDKNDSLEWKSVERVTETWNSKDADCILGLNARNIYKL